MPATTNFLRQHYRLSYRPDTDALPREAASNLCHVCLAFERNYLRPVDPHAYSGALQDPVLSVEFDHHESWAGLKRSALGGCDLCRVFRNSLLRDYRSFQATEETVEELDARLEREQGTKAFVKSRESKGRDGRYPGAVNNQTSWLEWAYNWSLVSYGVHGFGYAQFLLATDTVSCPQTIHGKFNARLCKRKPNLDLAKQWLLDCNQQDTECHEKYGCEQPSRPENPTRLLFIEKGATCVRLLATKHDEQYEYVTLSHLWGGKIDASTLSANLQDRIRNGLLTSMLPATLRDAVIAADALGYRYIWIDSLCIVQDDKQDWERECPRMASIYQSSSLTIAGPAAKDCNTGLLNDRNLLGNPSYQVQLQYRDEHGKPQGLITLYYCDIAPRQPNEVGRPPGVYRKEPTSVLQHRGWVFQESLLSRRILYFGSYQMYLDCRRGFRYEMSHIGEKASGPLTPHDRFTLRKEHKDASEYYNWWRELIEIYSACELTHVTDRLPAISGIAHRLKPPVPDEYLAGLWRNDLPRALLWQNCERSAECGPYIGPSWSWVSSPNPVKFDFSRAKPPYPWSAKVLHASILPAGADPYGQITDASLTVRGKLARAIVARNRGRFGDWIRVYPVSSETRWAEGVDFYPDNPDSFLSVPEYDSPSVELPGWKRFSDRIEDDMERPDLPRIALLLILLTKEHHFQAFALALEPVAGNKKTFRRIGLVGFVTIGGRAIDYSQREMPQHVIEE